MNIRAALHSLAIVAGLLGTGELVIHFLRPDVMGGIKDVAAIVAVSINYYMALTTSGSAKPKRVKEVSDA